jgi:GNAT superfamily N-acetyltransferase
MPWDGWRAAVIRGGNLVNSCISLRVLRPTDLAFADAVRALAGWNQTLDDWRRFLAMEPDGCYLAEWNGQPAGTATTITYGSTVAWIGMVLVHPDHRRRGVGSALLERCIEHLRERGVRSIKLDATPAGKRVYDGLGFKDEWPLARWERTIARPQAARPDARIRAWCEPDAQLVDRLDTAAFGASRLRLLQALVPQSRCALVFETAPGRIDGYGLIRKGARACYLGPVAATSSEAGLGLVEALVSRCEGEMIFWDIPDANAAAVEWARQRGFTLQRPLLRMYLGENASPSDSRKQFALAGPEVG